MLEEGLEAYVPKYKACLAQLKSALNQPKGSQPNFAHARDDNSLASEGPDEFEADPVHEDEPAEEVEEPADDDAGDSGEDSS